MKIDKLFPKHWTIFHQDETVQEQRVQIKKEIRFRLDGRKTRWNLYWFLKSWKPTKLLTWRWPKPKV